MRNYPSNALARLTLVLLVGLIHFCAQADDDVYNFYFQKAPGPTTVIQGGPEKAQEKSIGKSSSAEAIANTGAPSSATPLAGTSALQTEVAQDLGKKTTLKNWEINFGSTFVADRAGQWKGQTLGSQYNFNQYFGLQFGLTRTTQAENRNYAPSTNWQDPYDLYFGGILTPMTIHVFSHSLISISGLGGLLTNRTRIWSDGESQGSRDSKGNGQNRETLGYMGAQVALNIVDSFALLAQVRVRTDEKSLGQAMMGAVVRF